MSDTQSAMPKSVDERTRPRSYQATPVRIGRDVDVDPITILAHDLRNYLTPVSAHLTMLYKRAQRDQRETDMDAAARGRQALDYALHLITNLLDATRLEHGLFDLTRAPLNLSLLVRQAAEVFESSARSVVLCMPETLLVHADSERLRQVLHNLVANATTHAPRGVPVTCTMWVEQRDYDAWGVLTIRNGGAAIPAHLLSRLFQRFAAGPDSQGLGLGLYLSRGIVEAHGGTLTAHSAEGLGTCFVLMLPLAATVGGTA